MLEQPDPFLLASRVMIQQVRHLTRFLAQAHEQVKNSAPGTPARADLDHINSQRRKSDLLGLRWWAHKTAILNLSSGAEHVRGLMAIVVSDQLMPLPAMTVGRAIYEACVNTFWLIEPDVTTEQRIARWAGQLIHDSQEPPNALDSFGDAEASKREKARVVEARALGQKLMRQAGVELKAKGGDKSQETSLVTYLGASSQLKPNVTQFVARFTPNQQSLWPLFSGAAHSRAWLVEGLEGDAATIWSSVLVPLLDVSDALAIEVAAYCGLDARPIVEKTHLHRRTMLAQARPNEQGMRAGWDAYRRAGGAPTPQPKR